MTLPPDASNSEIMSYFRNKSYPDINNIKVISIKDINLSFKLNKLVEDYQNFIKKYDNIFLNFQTEDYANIEIFRSFSGGFENFNNLINAKEINVNKIDQSIKHLTDSFESFTSLPKIIINHHERLTEDQFNIIKSTLDGTFESAISLEDYRELSPRKKQIVTNAILQIYNEKCSHKYGYQSNDISQQYDIIQEELDSHNLQKQIAEIKDTHNLLTQIKENETKEITINLNNGYDKEAKILGRQIDFLNKIIINLFIFIFIIISFKIILILILDVDKKSIYIYITFVTLIISLSALITYFIKDRNRLITLQTHYKMNVLELSTMPEYMNELDSEQRKQMYIDLSSNYFKGSNRYSESDSNNASELEGITKSISDLTNLVSEIKGAIK